MPCSWSHPAARSLALLVCFAGGVLLTFLPAPCWADPPVRKPSEVLTLYEAAQLLKIPLREAAHLANEGQLPGRWVGKYWRVSRQALLEWLEDKNAHRAETGGGAKVPPSPTVAPLSADTTELSHPDGMRPQTDLPDSSLATIAGRGTGTGDATSTPSEKAPPATIGEAPEMPSAEQVFLRDQEILLKPNQATLEVGFFYSRTEQDGLSVLAVNSIPVLASSRGEQDLYIWNFTGRYGLPYEAQFFANLPLLYRDDTVTATVPGTTITADSTRTLTETGNLVLGLRRMMVQERLGLPSIIFSVEGHIPTRKRSYAVGGEVAVVKRIDPVALFANVNYLRIFNREFSEISRLEPENLIRGQVGYALSLNDAIAISTSVLGLFTTKTTFDDDALPTLDSIERFSLRLSLTALLAQGLYIEPSVSFALNGPKRVTLGFTLPYTFDVPALPALFSSDGPSP